MKHSCKLSVGCIFNTTTLSKITMYIGNYATQSHFSKNAIVCRAWTNIQSFLHITALSPLLQMIRWNISEMITLLLSKYQVCIVDIPIFNTKRFSTILWVVRKVSRIRFAQIKWTSSRSNYLPLLWIW